MVFLKCSVSHATKVTEVVRRYQHVFKSHKSIKNDKTMVNRKKDMDKPQHIKHEDKLRCLGRVGVPAALMTSVVFYP